MAVARKPSWERMARGDLPPLRKMASWEDLVSSPATPHMLILFQCRLTQLIGRRAKKESEAKAT